VLLGGPSAEREVSLSSGTSVAAELGALGHHVTKIDPTPGQVELPTGTDVVFIALHGTYGEDGQVQSELETTGVPYTGCGIIASRMAFDKVATKQRCLEHGIATAKYLVIDRSGSEMPGELKLPMVLKPAGQGSSVGLAFVNGREDWNGALAQAFTHGNEILVEEKIEGREVTVGILAGRPLPLVEVRPHQGPYDYKNKYTVGNTEYLCPAPFEDDVVLRIQQTGLKAFLAVGGRDYGRVDIIVRPTGEPVVLEVNTLPGMTETSLLPKAAAAAGITYGQLCQRMIDLALDRQPCTA